MLNRAGVEMVHGRSGCRKAANTSNQTQPLRRRLRRTAGQTSLHRTGTGQQVLVAMNLIFRPNFRDVDEWASYGSQLNSVDTSQGIAIKTNDEADD